MFPRFLLFLLSCTLIISAQSPRLELNLRAPNAELQAFNQLLASGNACGPASLLNSFQNGSPKWQALVQTIPGETDKSRLIYVIRRYGLQESHHLKGKKRWTHQGGINLTDLTDIGNEMRGTSWLPMLRNEILLAKSREKHKNLLFRAHSRLAKSMKKGLPPIVSLQRFAQQQGKGQSTPQWNVIKGHFIVVTALPKSLSLNATSFPFEYIDPWGGKIRRGIIHVSDSPFQRADEAVKTASLIAEVPNTSVGIEDVQAGQKSTIILSSTLGAF